ncbi:NUDIX hydrolase [Sphingomonas profundi]|uniref:NUDIX hydrolase n=1 Tax=Alterirhizorhabdus profundi TaxID=2681549 RepID=UPI0012E79C53|nr:NUDIX hydrolase [Sphingomonas profundi]
MTPPAEIIPAATLVLLRADTGGGAAELLMIERAGAMRFAAGALVFPGGRVDPGDHALAALLAPPDEAEIVAAKVAAVRETIEEVGIAVALAPAPDQPTIDRLRAGLAGGGAFAALLAAEGLAIDPAALLPFARWRPDLGLVRNFDTFFFIAAAPADAVATPDGGESVRALWGTAQALLAGADDGHHRLIFPTRRNLEWLARIESVEAAQHHATLFPMRLVTPWIEARDGEKWLCIPEDLGYPVTAQLASEALRS